MQTTDDPWGDSQHGIRRRPRSSLVGACVVYTDDHAPIGDVAFRCEPWELFNSAASIWGMATQSEPDLACQLEATAEWYEGMARTLQDVRGLPDVLVAF